MCPFTSFYASQKSGMPDDGEESLNHAFWTKKLLGCVGKTEGKPKFVCTFWDGG